MAVIKSSMLVAIVMADDTVAIMQFITETSDWSRLATAEAVEAEIGKTNFGDDKKPIKSWRFITESEIPQRTPYRNAWSDHPDQGIVHDMPKAREIHRSIMRHERASEFANLDTAYIKADEKGDAAAKGTIAARKQKLRDLPAHPSIETAQTVQELAALTLESLTS